MGRLSTVTLIVFAFSPLALTLALLACVVWKRLASGGATAHGPGALLNAAVRRMPDERRDWGKAMLAELCQINGTFGRWLFALGCARVALFPPATTGWPRYVADAFRRLGPVCGLLSVGLPPLGLPLLYFTSIACNAFMTHDNFSSGELVPTILGVCILTSIACILSGVPLGIAGLIRREKVRWLSLAGPVSSISIFSYLQIVQHLAQGLD
jgi:hypothetical protein